MSKIYVIDTGEYENNEVVGAYSSPDIARQKIIESYISYRGVLYIVEWSDLNTNEFSPGRWFFEGKFESVPGMVAAHTKGYQITEYDVDKNV